MENTVGPVAFLLIGAGLMAWVRLALGRPERLTRGRRALLTGLTALVAFAYVSLFLREDLWIDTLWTGLAATVVFTVSYLIVRRAVVAFAAAALLVAAGSWAMAPRLAGQRTGDPQLLARLTALDGYHGLAVAVVDLHATPQVRFANIGSTTTTRFELGSLAKPLTGLVIADAVDRGEIDLASPVSAYLPLRGSAAGAATMGQLVSHTAGYPRDGAAYNRKVLRDMPAGRNPNTADLEETLRDIREAVLSPAGDVSYSNLGGAAAGQATAAAAGLSYPDLMRTRLFGPMRMTGTAVQTTPMVSGGRSASGRPAQPWTMDGLAPAGGIVSTTADLALLATAILDGTAPGLGALTASTATGVPGSVGIFWGIHRTDGGAVIDEHSGSTAGYASYIGVDLRRQKAVVVLADVAKDVGCIGGELVRS